jgi:acyl-CoA hydrolase
MNQKTQPRSFTLIKPATEWLIGELGSSMKVATPLGLGKPNLLLNEIYNQTVGNRNLSLTLYTALSLTPPHPAPDLERRFIKPFADRQWGADYPVLRYWTEADASVEVHEFYFQAGAALHRPRFQQNYQSINYTHVPRRLFESEIQVIVQLIAKRETESGVRYSLSCNPDLTLDVKDLYARHERPLLIVGVVHPDLPFLGGEAEVDTSFFNAIIDGPETHHTLFALPRVPIEATDHAIGFYASQLILDDGTLQIGIGSLSDAIVHSLLIRHQKNPNYLQLMTLTQKPASTLKVSHSPFQVGLYGLSEMITDGFMYLRHAGILIREVLDESSGRSTYLHGAFFLGTKVFYQWLRNLDDKNFSGLRMSRISKINDLYDPNEILLRKQRKNARFVNTCMQVNLLGGAASETLENGNVISGVGGQYNFVSMSHELEDARSILLLRSTRTKNGKRESNIVWTHAQLTIPRHLRDVVVTEYGIADIRNTTDSETIAALINIADSEFQTQLLGIAKRNKKIAADYQIPSWACNNTPQSVNHLIDFGKTFAHFGPFPFGSDFTPEEERLAVALGKLEPLSTLSLIKIVFSPLSSCEAYESEMKRMEFGHSIKHRAYRKLLRWALSQTASH